MPNFVTYHVRFLNHLTSTKSRSKSNLIPDWMFIYKVSHHHLIQIKQCSSCICFHLFNLFCFALLISPLYLWYLHIPRNRHIVKLCFEKNRCKKVNLNQSIIASVWFQMEGRNSGPTHIFTWEACFSSIIQGEVWRLTELWNKVQKIVIS